MTKFLSLFCTAAIIISMFAGITLETSADSDTEITKSLQSASSGYFDYYNENADKSFPDEEIEITANNIECAEDTKNAIKSIEGCAAAVLNEENGWCEWSFDIEYEGNYEIWLNYYPIAKTGKEILLSLTVDGKLPYTEANNFKLNRHWKDLILSENGAFEQDDEGNDIRPQQVEVAEWIEAAFTDTEGLYDQPYIINLQSGSHKIRLSINRENAAVSKIVLKNTKAPVDYRDYISKYENESVEDAQTVILQAEKAYKKTNSNLYPTYDRSDASTLPNHPARLRLNTIGQSNWGKNSDTIFWRVEVPKAGLYKLAFRARQNFNQGMSSYRTLKINGEVPFLQAQNIAFPYSQDWYMLTLGDEEPQYVYLKSGDVISLTCTSGKMSEILRNVRKGLLDLNEIYRKIISITSAEPDIYRSYSLDKQIPNLEKDLKSYSEFIKKTADIAEKINGSRGSQVSILDYVSRILSEMAENPDSIPERLSTFKDGIDNIGSLVLTLGNQPLELDYIAFIPENEKVPKVSAGFFSSVSFFIKQFLYSFSDDYTFANKKDCINVWVSTGRDQAQIIKNLITDHFTKDTGIAINLNLVDTGATLIKATLAGKGPDVALTLGVPLELACRDALVCLDDYDLSEITNQFYEQTLVPMRYNGKLYAIPESENFDVMFYRTDIFDELNLKVPDTWDEFYSVMETLQKNNLVVGIPEINSANMGVSDGIATFDKFLLQAGGSYYNEDKTKVEFQTDMAYEAFEKWVKLYQTYRKRKSACVQ